MYIRKDDVVEVVTGDDKGTRGKVLRVMRSENKVVVEGVNRVYRHLKPSRRNPQGGRLSKEMPVNASNVALIDPATGKRALQGTVTRDKNAKTRRVEVERLVRHPKYGKYIKQRTICYTHDENNESHLGDTVEIEESRPLSRTKRWVLKRIVTKAPSRALSNLEGRPPGSEAVTAATDKK